MNTRWLSALTWVDWVLTSKGATIDANDMLIAAIGLTHGLTVVTHNTREFGRIDGLSLEDWEVD